MNGFERCELGLAMILAGAAPAMGQTSPLTWSRGVRGGVEVRSPLCAPANNGFSYSAPTNFNSWEFGASAGGVSCHEAENSYMIVNAGQSSRMTPSLIRAGTWAGCTRSEVVHPSVSVTVRSASWFEYSFYVDARTPYVLTCEGDRSGGTGRLVFTSPTGVLVDRAASEEGPFELSGELLVGVHTLVCTGTLEAQYPAGAVPEHEWGTMGFQLVMPSRTCPCDWNSDGAVESSDVFEYIAAFLGGGGDFDFDGVTNSQDFFDFLSCFFAPPGGCA
jgi:hypothetical protein